MIEKNTKLYKILFIIGCVVLAVAFSFGLKTIIDYKNNEYSEERPHGDCSTGCSSCTDNGYCSSCSEGYYVSSGGATGVVCTVCPMGYSCAGGTADKVACSGSTYQDETGQSSCKTCSGTVDDDHTTCTLTQTTPCSLGYYHDGSGCASCPVGFSCNGTSKTACDGEYEYQDETGQSSCKTCSGTVNDDHTTCEVTVTITGVSSLYVGKTVSLIATVSDGSTVTWTTSDTHIATVSTSGIVTGIAQGTVTITATTASGAEGSKTIIVSNPPCSAGYYVGQNNTCEVCTAGYYCEDGIAQSACPSGTTSSLGAKSESECYEKADDSECNVSVSIASKHVSIDEDGLSENSYYAVKVTVTGNGCNGQKLTYTATNAKSLSLTSVSDITSGATYYFNVYPQEACTSSTAIATLTNGNSASATISTVLNDWKTETGCWTTSQIDGKPIGSHNADNEGVNEYYSDFDDTQQCYTLHAYRYGCGTSSSTSESDACYMNNSTGIYVWGKYKNDSSYTLISGINSADTCKPSSEGGLGEEVYACYKNDDDNYMWATTPPTGYKLVESIKDETNCKVNDDAACYIDANNKYVWGDYSNNTSYQLVDTIKAEETCVNPAACYKDQNGDFVWGNYAYNDAYSLVANINSQSDCGETVNVPSTSASTATIIYISVIVMLIAGGSIVYYVYNKKKFS